MAPKATESSVKQTNGSQTDRTVAVNEVSNVKNNAEPSGGSSSRSSPCDRCLLSRSWVSHQYRSWDSGRCLSRAHPASRRIHCCEW